MKSNCGSRIPPDFRLHVNRRIRQVMKAEVVEVGSVYALCTEVARELGMHPTAVYFWYEGYCLPTIYNLVRFADLYDVSIDYLLGRTAYKQLVKNGHLRAVA